MMKSFFKKLAFVMALAMVVSMAAPAGSVFAAESGIAIQDTKEIVTEYELKEVDATVDFCFIGAPKDWKTTYEWTSSDESVATVDKAGIVTAVAPGTATITITAGVDKSYVETVKITVKGDVNNYTVKQINHKQVLLTFEESVNFTADDVTVNKLFDGEEVFWPIQNVKVSGNTITFETYVNYEDGEEYIVRVGAEDEGTIYNTAIGDVTSVKLAYGTTKDAKGNIVYADKAYSNGEDGEDLTVYLWTKLYNAQGVDVTEYYTTEDVVYDVANDSEDIMIDNYAGEMTFYKVNELAVVTATYTYYDADGNQHDIKSIPTTIRSEKAPAYGIKKVDEWAIVKSSVTNYYDVNWNTHDIKAEDDEREDYNLVVKFTDTNGNQYITSDQFTNLPWGLYEADDSDYDFAEKGYYVSFVSGNTNKLLVGSTDGDLTTSDKANVAVILSLHNYDSEKDDFFVKNVTAFQVNVQAKRKVNSVVLNNNSTTVITKADEPGFTTKTVEAYVYDQYGDKWYDNVGLKFSSSVDGAPELADATYYAGDKAVIAIDGSKFTNLTKQTVSYKVTEAKNGNTATLKVVVKNPKYDDGSIKVTSYSLAANDIDMVGNWWDGSNTKSTTVHYYELSNSIEVGHKDEVTLIASSGALKIAEGETSKGKQYVVIYDAKGNVVPASGSAVTGVVNGKSACVVEVQPGEYEVVVAEENSNGIMQYAPTGAYTAKVLEVRDFSKGYAVFKTKYEKTFNVSNSNENPTLKKQENVSVTVALDSAYADKTDAQKMAAAIKTVVKKAFSVNRWGNEWDYTTDNIAKVEYKMNAGQDSVIIRSVTFNVPLANGNGFFQYKLTINKSVDVTITTK